ncbi:ferritin-3, chloroplastic-like [Glycine soja]|uniref:ferritin-3, chloroplastic-like n=1 Tax=Glycine soja TaxID=3848 RepID=UPI00103FFB66|nr:ferritin-3, chloroplastic-like [Glycine soja]
MSRTAGRLGTGCRHGLFPNQYKNSCVFVSFFPTLLLSAVKKELNLVCTIPQAFLARQKHTDEEGFFLSVYGFIFVEYNVLYVYHAMFAYFNRDNVALKGLANVLIYLESSEEEREHVEKLMEYQNKRGGKVKLQSIVMPFFEFDHEEKGCVLYEMLHTNTHDVCKPTCSKCLLSPMNFPCEICMFGTKRILCLFLKLTNEKLLNLHRVDSKNNDVQLADFIESKFLGEQVK